MSGLQPQIPANSGELFELLKLGMPDKPTDIDFKQLRYVIYARKSTTGDERQERSIEDQINACMEKIVVPEGLTIVGEPIQEKCSAKDPDIRQKFVQMLEDVRSRKIDGIICWHPDRLSRNMREAGDIIDLLDKGILKDLRFATSTFENNPTGKMLLGISFVLSKQYSEHLSETVTRGNESKTKAGIFFDEMKHGYLINDGRLYPDGESYKLIRQAFDMRLENMSVPDIAKWLNETNYKLRKKGKEPAKYVFDKDNLGKVFRDPLYAGVLKYGKSLSHLSEIYEFTPMVTVEEFFKINKIKEFTSAKLVSSMMSNKRENTKANLLRNIVCCGYCNKTFSSGLTRKELKSGTTWYYFYKCETEGCEFQGRSVRAGIVLNYAYSFLEKYHFTTKTNYTKYVEDATAYSKSQAQSITSEVKSLSRLVGDKNNEYERAKKMILDQPKLSKHYNLETIKDEYDQLNTQLKTVTKQRSEVKDSVLTYEKYLELFGNISVKLRKVHDMAVIDQTLRKFFSNFTVKSSGKGKEQRYEITHKLNEPFAGFVNSKDFDCGRG